MILAKEIGADLKAKQIGITSEIKPIIDELIEVGIYIDSKLYNKVL